MISFFIPIAEALIAGYLVAVVVYMVFLLGITRLGRPLLLNGTAASRTYSVLHTATWTVAAAAGAYLCCGMSPLAPYGSVGFPMALAVVLGLVALRNFQQLPGQMSPVALGLILSGILGGTVIALFAHHALPLHV